jgi:hypothetical protein
MHTSARRINATPTVRVDATVVRLDVSGEDATIDMGENPAYHPPAQVTELIIGYKASRNLRDNTTTSEVTDITYRIANKDYDTASVHPKYLDQPDAWPVWVRDLVKEYDPAA